MSTTDNPALAAVILAAGSSSRMGQPKQLLVWKGETLIRSIIAKVRAAGINTIYVVLGAHAEKVAANIADLPVQTIENPDWASGMGSSVVAGTRAAMTTQPEALLFVLVDQPFVQPELLRQLLHQYTLHPDAIIVSDYGTHPGVPALFPSFFFPRLLSLEGDAGARKLLRQHQGKTISISFPEGNFDLDTPEDWRLLLDNH
ncbi:MAG: nucleotidyltransferase family protein [Saprospiraceae bacterium]|nr:nucleotidyltransferase family protein [Saprospiraceae bacterium]